MGLTFSEFQDYDTLVNRFQYISQTYPNRELMIFYRGTKRIPYTAKILYELAGQFAEQLRRQGFKKGDVITNTLPNSPERLITDIGILMAGCVAMQGQILLADGADFFQSAQRARCAAVILGRDGDQGPAWKLLQSYVGDVISGFTFHLQCNRAPEMTKAILVTRKDESVVYPLLKSLQESKDAIFCCSEVKAKDMAIVNATSGSTGYSKLVGRSHKDIIPSYEETMEFFGRVCPGVEGQTYYSDRPLGWLGGFPFGMYCAGDTRVLTDRWESLEDNSGESMWRIIRSEQCKLGLILSLDTAAILSYLQSTDDEEAKQFRLTYLMTGGQPAFKNQLTKYFYMADNLGVGYGSTESFMNSCGVISKQEVNTLKDFYCGHVPEFMDIRVMDSKGTECPVGESGEIWIKGSSVFRGYYNQLVDRDPATVKAFTPDGYYLSGDYGFFDEDGILYVKGRRSDVIMYGSNVVYPGWLEERILTHPDVQEACVVPVPDPVLFHNICACVKPIDGHTLTESSLKEFCDKLFLAQGEGTPKPKYFMILNDNFPETSTGKNDRKTLREMATQKFGLYN